MIVISDTTPKRSTNDSKCRISLGDAGRKYEIGEYSLTCYRS
jgi:hypothetical protein